MKVLSNVLKKASLAVAISVALCVQAGEFKPMQLNMAAQSADTALIELAQKSGVQIVFEPSLVAGVHVPAVNGYINLNQALDNLLQGTHLAYQVMSDNLVVIKQAQSEDADKNSSVEKSRVIEEVIVTAQKRTERLQDVPASIGVVGAEEIDKRGLINAEDYLRGMPGVSQLGDDGRVGGQAIIIRGIETSTGFQNANAGPTTATYFGEAPTTYSGGIGSNIDIKLVDIERVEVLRGPQGTTFGSASVGGAVRTIPVAPQLDRVEGSIAAGYSVTSGTGGDNNRFQVVGNAPLIEDRLAIRGVAYTFSESGYYRNLAGSDPTVQASAVVPLGIEAFAVDKEEMGAHYVDGGRVSALFQATDDLRFTLSYLTQKSEVDGWGVASGGLGPYDQITFRVAPEHVHRGENSGVFDQEIDIANATVEYDFGWADLLASYSYIEGEMANRIPYGAGGPYDVFSSNRATSQAIDNLHRADAGEIRLATKLEGDWNFLAGLYFENLDDSQNGSVIWFGDSAANFLGERVWNQNQGKSDVTQEATFGEISWNILPTMTLTVGARTYQYERTNLNHYEGPQVGGVSDTRLKSKEDGALFRTNLSFKPNEQLLLYAGWSEGFRLGRATRPAPSAICDVNNDGVVDGTNIPLGKLGNIESDTADNYEIGGKFALLDQRLRIDAAVYRIDWSDIPVGVALPCGFGFSLNAAEARSEGVEVQADFQITDVFGASFGASWTHARLTEDVPLAGYSSGDRLPGSPKVNANLGLQYDFAIAGHGVFVRTDATYVGSFYDDVSQSFGNKSGDYVKIDAMARVMLDNFNIDLFVRNLTNEDAFTSRVYIDPRDVGFRLRPRTVGINVSIAF